MSLVRIGNRELLRRLADLLGIEGVKQRTPIELDTSRLVPTICIPGVNVPETWVSADLVNKPLVGLSGWSWSLFGVANAGATSDNANPMPFSVAGPDNRAHWIRNIRMLLAYDAAGSAADAAKLMQVFAALIDLTVSPTRICFVMNHVFEVKGALNFYEFQWPESNLATGNNFGNISTSKGWNGYVPPGWGCGFWLARVAGGVFPANTTANGNVVVSEMPDGMTYSGPT